MKRIILLVLTAIPFFVIGCASNPPIVTVAQKEAPVLVPVLETKKEIIFPSATGAVVVPVKNGDIKHAKMEAAAKLVSVMQKKCEWKKPLNYYGDKVVIEVMVKEDAVYARARMDSSLCPEKN